MKRENKGADYKKRVRIISIAALAAFLILATILCIPLIRDLRTEEGLTKMRERLESYSGIVGVLVFTAIQDSRGSTFRMVLGSSTLVPGCAAGDVPDLYYRQTVREALG